MKLLTILTVLSFSLLSTYGFAYDCMVSVGGNKSGKNETLHKMAYDKNIDTFFTSIDDNWQYIIVDLGCVRTIHGLRRYMTLDGKDASGIRVYKGWGIQGEGFSYSMDGNSWLSLTNTTTRGWESYRNYVPHAWGFVNYGWSYWLKPLIPVTARYVRFNWDGNNDSVNEIDIDFGTVKVKNLHCDAGGDFICDAIAAHGGVHYSFNWRITAGVAHISRVVGSSSGTISSSLGTCKTNSIFGIEVTVTDEYGDSDRAHKNVKCYDLFR